MTQCPSASLCPITSNQPVLLLVTSLHFCPDPERLVQEGVGPSPLSLQGSRMEVLNQSGGRAERTKVGVLDPSRLPASSFLITEPAHLPGKAPVLHISNWPTGPKCPKTPGFAALRDKGRANKEEGGRKKSEQTKAGVGDPVKAKPVSGVPRGSQVWWIHECWGRSALENSSELGD